MMNDDYYKGIEDTLEFIYSVEDGDLDLIIWKLKKVLKEKCDFYD